MHPAVGLRLQRRRGPARTQAGWLKCCQARLENRDRDAVRASGQPELPLINGRADYRESTGSDQVPVDLVAPPGRRAVPLESPSEVRVASRFKVPSTRRRREEGHPRAINSRGAPTSHQ
jgi:hypothetical protein